MFFRVGKQKNAAFGFWRSRQGAYATVYPQSISLRTTFCSFSRRLGRGYFMAGAYAAHGDSHLLVCCRLQVLRDLFILFKSRRDHMVVVLEEEEEEEEEEGSMVIPVDATQQQLTPTLSQGSLERTSCTLDEEQQAGCSSISRSFSGIGGSSCSSAGSGSSASDDCHSSRVIWVAGINRGTDKDHAHAGLKHILQQIVGPGDHIFALVLFDNIPSELGITFAFTRDGFRSTAERKMLKWLSEKLNFWRVYLQKLVQHCSEKNVTLELRVCAAHSLGETAVREAQYLQATDIILERNDGNDSTTRKIAKLLSEKTEARVGLMHKRQTSNRLEAVLQVPENRQPHDFGSHELTLSLDKQTLVSNMLNGLHVVCQESEDPYYLSISIDLSSRISK